MAILKCKMCGGDIIAIEGQTYGTCDSCGSTVTLPNVNDQRMENLFNRANHFRMVSEFDKAVATYEMILNEDNSNAEAHWGLLLSRYGIEYVEDPTSHERIPTCHRIQNDPILTDDDYLAAVQHAPDGYTRSLYESEGKRLSELQRGLLQVSAQTEPFDIFICYKETTEGGSRTNDSALAQDIYYQLTNAGYKVFFSRVTLESMLGQQYEPHIFAALNSAKVMLAIGTKPEYFNAVWVKNEWSRFLALSRKDRSKVLIPCYRDMNVYDLPDELSMLQSQDMGKIGFIQDLLRGIRKVTQKDEPKPAAQIITQQVVTAGNATVESLMKRAKLFMEDKDFASANEYLDKVLDIDPEYAPAYLGKVQVEMQFQKETQFSTTLKSFEALNDWKKALRFATPEQRTLYKKYLSDSMTARETHRQQEIYDQASQMLNDAKTIEALSDCYEAQKMFRSITGFKDTETRITACEQKAQAIQQCEYEETLNLYESAKAPEDFEIVVARFSRLGEYKDSASKAVKAENKKRTLEKKRFKRNLTITSIVATVATFVIVFITVVKPSMDYNSAKSELAAGNYDAAYSAFVALDDYKDAQAMAQESMYQKGTALLAVGEYDNARVAFESVFGYSDAATMAQESMYQKGTVLLAAGEYDNAKVAFESVSSYSDAATMAQESMYQKGTVLLATGEYDNAKVAFESVSSYSDAATMAQESMYQKGTALLAAEEYNAAADTFESISEYKDAAITAREIRYTLGMQYLEKGDNPRALLELRKSGKVTNNEGLCRELQNSLDKLISSGDSFNAHTVALKADGTVVAVGNNESGQCNVQDWSDIIAVAAGSDHTIGLKSDGSVIATGSNKSGQCNIEEWSDIVDVAAGCFHTVGLKADGTVITIGENKWGACYANGWKNVISISAGGSHTVAVKSNTCVSTAGYNYYDQRREPSTWMDMVSIDAGYGHIVGLTSDGHVVATGNNNSGQCNTQDWEDIVAIEAGYFCTIGLKADGTMVATGENNNGECGVRQWDLWD